MPGFSLPWFSKPSFFNNYCQVEVFIYIASAKFNPQAVLPSGLNYSVYYEVCLEELEILKLYSMELKFVSLFTVIHLVLQLYVTAPMHRPSISGMHRRDSYLQC